MLRIPAIPATVIRKSPGSLFSPGFFAHIVCHVKKARILASKLAGHGPFFHKLISLFR